MLKQMCNKYKLLFVVQILIILVLLPKCFSEYELVYSMLGEDYVGTETQAEGYTEIRGDSIRLTPGIYRVCVVCSVSENQVMSVEVKTQEDEEAFRSILSNAVIVFPRDEYIDYEVCVTQEVSTAHIVCGLTNVDASGLVKLDIYRTPIGSRMLLFATMVGLTLLNGMLLLREYILDGKVNRKQLMVGWGLAAIVLIAYFPYLTDYYYIGADTLFHWGRVAFLKDTLLQGLDFPVRIQDTWLFDHGYAVSIFYGDLLIYIPAILMAIGFSLMSSFKIFILIVLIMTAVISYFCLKKCVKNEYAALFGSMIYLLAPYCIFNIYNRSAIGEFTAMAFLPLILCGMYLLYTEDVETKEYKKYKWYIVWGMSLVIQCHIITTELTAILMAMFCVCFWKKTFRKQTFIQLLQAVGFVALITAWFWIPLIYMMGADTYYLQKLPQGEMQERGLELASLFQLVPNKGSAQTGMYHCEPAHIGIGVLLLLVVYPLWKHYTKKKDGAISCLAIFGLVTLVLSTKYFPWDFIKTIPIIGDIASSLQFPTRWMIWATVIVSGFAAFYCRRIMSDGGKYIKMVCGLVVAITIVSSIYHVNSIVVTYDATYLYEEENMGTHNVGNGEYVLKEAEITDIRFHRPKAEEELIWDQYEKEGTEVSIYLKNSTDKLLHIEIPLLGYKGYAIDAEGVGETPYITEERGAHGDLRIAVPAGYEGKIQISYKGFALFRIAEIISYVTLLALLGRYLYKKRKRMGNEE